MCGYFSFLPPAHASGTTNRRDCEKGNPPPLRPPARRPPLSLSLSLSTLPPLPKKKNLTSAFLFKSLHTSTKLRLLGAIGLAGKMGNKREDTRT
jgi:hypothetical protein